MNRKAAQKGIVRDLSITVVAAASIYVACRLNGFPRTLREIVHELKVDRRKLSQTYTILNRQLRLKMPIPRPEDYLPRIGEALELETLDEGIAPWASRTSPITDACLVSLSP